MSEFTFSDWQKRIANRTDITCMLTHLTKPTVSNIQNLTEDEINYRAIDTLIKILRERTIKGSTTSSGFICGKTPATCFQEVPLYSLIQNVEYEKSRRQQNSKIRYCGIGLSFSKFYIYDKGGRPVIYENTLTAKKFLPPGQYWRIVNLDMPLADDSNIIDWTHEREWRVPNSFEFDIDVPHVLLYDKKCWDYFFEKCPEDILKKIYGITLLKSILM